MLDHHRYLDEETDKFLTSIKKIADEISKLAGDADDDYLLYEDYELSEMKKNVNSLK